MCVSFLLYGFSNISSPLAQIFFASASVLRAQLCSACLFTLMLSACLLVIYNKLTPRLTYFRMSPLPLAVIFFTSLIFRNILFISLVVRLKHDLLPLCQKKVIKNQRKSLQLK